MNLNTKSLGCPAFLNKSKTSRIDNSKFSKQQIFELTDKKYDKILLKSLQLAKSLIVSEVDHHSRSKTPDEERKNKNVEIIMPERENQLNFSSIATQDTQKILHSVVESTINPFRKIHHFEQVNKQSKYSKQKISHLKRTDIFRKTPQKASILKRQFYSGRLTTTEKFEKMEYFQKQSEMKISDFEFLSMLGKGFDSCVFLMRHKTLKMLFAIKVIEKAKLNTENRKQSLFRELKIHSYLKHPNILTLFKIMYDSKNIYMILQYASGGSLYTQLKKSQQISEKKVATYIRDISRGLKEMHNSDIIHRDLKLENILLLEGVAKIADLGCSVKSFCMRKSTIGSPAYLSPEQLNKNFYGKKIDIWSIGIMTYQMLFGITPFDKQILAALSTGQLVFQMKLRFPVGNQASEQAKDFLTRCLNKRQNDRMDIDQVLNHPFLKFQEPLKL